MLELETYSYRDGKFTLSESPLGAFPERGLDEIEYPQWMRSQGFEPRYHMPMHEQHEFAEWAAHFWKHTKSPLWLTELMFHGDTECHILSPNTADFLLLQRDVLTPLVSYGNRDIVIDAIIEAGHCLFDQRNGLPCAQRVKDRDMRQEAERFALRQEKKEHERLKQELKERLEQERLNGVKQ